MSTLSTPTLQKLLTNVRNLLNIKDPNTAFWTPTELTEYIDEAIRIYFAEAVIANEGYFTVQTGTTGSDLNIVSGVETIALPTDCFQVKNVWKKLNTNWALLSYRNNMTEGYSTQGGSASNGYLPYYEFQGNSLVLRPTPNFSETGGIRLEYIQLPDQMFYGGDQLTNQISPVFKQVIEMYAVYKAKVKEALVNGGTMHTIAASNLSELAKQYRDSLSRRSKNPTSIVAYNPESDGI